MFARLSQYSWAALTLAVAPAAAQTTALPPQVSTAASLDVSNTVHCAYDLMSTEDREMALLLLEREVGSSRKSHANSPNLKVIDRLVDEARARCAAPYAWSRGRSDAAVSYAMNELMSEGVAQALEAKGRSAAPVDAYFVQHRAELTGMSEIKGANAEAFQGYLIGQGWAKSETTTMAIAEFYLESLLTREDEAQHFAAALKDPLPGFTKRKAKNPPPRARSARRGRQ